MTTVTDDNGVGRAARELVKVNADRGRLRAENERLREVAHFGRGVLAGDPDGDHHLARAVERLDAHYRSRTEVCGGRDPKYPGQTCTFPPRHNGPCIDASAVEG